MREGKRNAALIKCSKNATMQQCSKKKTVQKQALPPSRQNFIIEHARVPSPFFHNLSSFFANPMALANARTSHAVASSVIHTICLAKQTGPYCGADPGEKGRDGEPPVADQGAVDEGRNDIGILGRIWIHAERIGIRVGIQGPAVHLTTQQLVTASPRRQRETYQAISSLTNQAKKKMRKMLRPVSPPQTFHRLSDFCRNVFSRCSQNRLFHHLHMENVCT